MLCKAHTTSPEGTVLQYLNKPSASKTAPKKLPAADNTCILDTVVDASSVLSSRAMPDSVPCLDSQYRGLGVSPEAFRFCGPCCSYFLLLDVRLVGDITEFHQKIARLLVVAYCYLAILLLLFAYLGVSFALCSHC